LVAEANPAVDFHGRGGDHDPAAEHIDIGTDQTKIIGRVWEKALGHPVWSRLGRAAKEPDDNVSDNDYRRM
jgi:hypothetical protein